jgi:hypothetical protein
LWLFIQKAEEQLLFKRTYVKEVVPKFAFTKNLISLRRLCPMTLLLIFESPLEFLVSYGSKTSVDRFYQNRTFYFPQQKVSALLLLLMLNEI